MDFTFYQLLWFFLAYAFLGWLCETALAAAKKGRLLNRGFLNTPFSPVYGLAGVLFAIFLPGLHHPFQAVNGSFHPLISSRGFHRSSVYGPLRDRFPLPTPRFATRLVQNSAAKQ